MIKNALYTSKRNTKRKIIPYHQNAVHFFKRKLSESCFAFNNALPRYRDNLKSDLATCTWYLLLETPNYSPSRDAAFSCCRQLEERCAVDIGSWLSMVKHKLFRFSLNSDVDDLDRQIVHADALVYLGSLTAATVEPMSVGTAAKAVYGMSRAWKIYQQSYAAVLKVYSAIFDVGNVIIKTQFCG
ncbi:uncharacterized protein LOC126835861 [Adelges cooleyi]|uniref:uncharacterized protein LOC126835861 n=1 Tax=Adelges cooleyi TaxID=133065 RepID=UPI0021802A3F|nr:uncharacterized protein LOC126835861 [Adelges cooleyi]